MLCVFSASATETQSNLIAYNERLAQHEQLHYHSYMLNLFSANEELKSLPIIRTMYHFIKLITDFDYITTYYHY